MSGRRRLLRLARGRFWSAPGATGQTSFSRVDLHYIRARTLVKFYYVASVYISYDALRYLAQQAPRTEAWDFLWPVAWIGHFRSEAAIDTLALACLAASLLAAQFTSRRLFRGLFAVLYLGVAAAENSLGGINHQDHAWLWTAACLTFLPDAAASERPPRCVKMSYLTVFIGVQLLLFLFYSLAGFWKTYYGAIDLLRGVEGNFAPRGLALQIADHMLETGSRAPLADFAIDHYWVVWLPMIVLVYIQLMALPAALRPRLHMLWGYLLIAFHVGTGLLLQIFFAKHVLLLMLFFVLSPFRPTRFSLLPVIGDLPVLGGLVRGARRLPRPTRARPALGI